MEGREYRMWVLYVLAVSLYKNKNGERTQRGHVEKLTLFSDLATKPRFVYLDLVERTKSNLKRFLLREIVFTASRSRASWKSFRRLSSYCFSLKILFCHKTSFSCRTCMSCTAILRSCWDCRISRLISCSSR